MRIAAVALTLAVLVGAPGCTSDSSSTETLVALLLKDQDVTGVHPGLSPKAPYSTGRDYGVVARKDLTGPTKGAVTGVVRQWSRDFAATRDGDPWSVVSSVVEFPSASDAETAAEASLKGLPVGPARITVAGVRGGVTPSKDGVSSGVGVARLDSVLVTLEVSFVGEGDQSTFSRLADVLAQRVG